MAEFNSLKGGQRFIKICLSELSIGCAFVGGVLGQALGGWDGFLVSLVVFVVVDYITGMLCGIKQGNLASSRGFQGILKKILIFLVVGLGHLLDTALLGGSGAPLRSAMIFFYLSNEGLSIIENLGSLGVPIPRRLKQVVMELGDGEE